MEAGDLLLWDSRTIHCSSPGVEAPDAKAELMRAVSLICFMPRAMSNEKVIAQRRHAIDGVISTTNKNNNNNNTNKNPQNTQTPKPEHNTHPAPPTHTEYQ